MRIFPPLSTELSIPPAWALPNRILLLTTRAADKKEFMQISKAVGMGFVVMGVLGYVIKLIHIPVNNILVGGA